MATFRRIAERRQEKARIRYLRARRLDSHEDDAGVWAEDAFLDETSAYESTPTEKSDIPFCPFARITPGPGKSGSKIDLLIFETHGRYAGIGVYQGTEKEEGSVRGGATVDVNVTVNQNPTDRAHRNPPDGVNMADFDILPIDEDTLRLALVTEDLQNAIDMPTAG